MSHSVTKDLCSRLMYSLRENAPANVKRVLDRFELKASIRPNEWIYALPSSFYSCGCLSQELFEYLSISSVFLFRFNGYRDCEVCYYVTDDCMILYFMQS